MATGPISTAFVELKPKLSGSFESQVRSAINPALDRVSTHVDKTALDVSRSFEAATEKVERSFDSAADAITADSKRAGDAIDRGLSDGASRAGGALNNLKGLISGVVVAAAAAKGVQFLSGAITSASALGESLSKIEAQLGAGATAAIEKFANSAAKSLGQSRQEALDAIGTFNTLAKSAGLAGTDAANFSIEFDKLAVDLASFNNTSTEESVMALGAALRGESEPIRRFGVLLDEATLQASALSEGLVKPTKNADGIAAALKRMEAAQVATNKATKEFGPDSAQAQAALEKYNASTADFAAATRGAVAQLTPQQKVLAAQASILKQTSDAQGDAVRTGGQLAGQQKRLGAVFADVKQNIGAAFLPAVLGVVSTINQKVVPAFEAFRGAFKLIVGGFQEGDVTSDGFNGKMERLGIAVRKVFDGLKELYEGQIKPFAAFLLATVVPAIGQVAGKLFDFGLFLADHIDTIKSVATVIAVVLIPHFIKLGIEAIRSAAKQVAAWVTSKAAAIQATIVSSAQFAIQIARWVALAAAATVNAAIIAAAWLISLGPIALVVAAVVGLAVVVYKNWETIKNAITTAATFVLDFLRTNWPLILAILTGPIGLAVLAIVKNWDKIKDGASSVWNWVREKFTALVDFVSGLPGKISSAASGMWNGITNAFKAAINTIIRGWNRLEFKVPGFKVGPIGYDGFTLGMPDISPLAMGSVINQPTLGLLGEAGREVVVPLTKPARAAELVAESGLLKLISPFFQGNSPSVGMSTKLAAAMPPLPSRVAAAGGATFGPGSVTVTFAGALPTEAQAYATGKAAARGLRDEMARTELRRAVRAR